MTFNPFHPSAYGTYAERELCAALYVMSESESSARELLAGSCVEFDGFDRERAITSWVRMRRFTASIIESSGSVLD